MPRCVQVDLTEASIRPGRPAPWLAALRTRLMEAVRRSPPPPSSLSPVPGAPHSATAAAAVASTGTELTVLVGTWQHDLDQANSLPQKHQQGREQRQEQQQGGRPLAGWRDAGSDGNPGGGSAGWRSQHQPAGATARRSPWAWQEQGAQAGNGAGGMEAGEGSGWEDGMSGSNAEGGGGYVTVRVFSVDSHRLAAALDARGQLVPLVREAVLRQLGIKSANVRISNML